MSSFSSSAPAVAARARFLNVLNGTIPHTLKGTLKGQATVCGKSVPLTKVATFATEVGMVFQDPEAQIINTRVVTRSASAWKTFAGRPPKSWRGKPRRWLSSACRCRRRFDLRLVGRPEATGEYRGRAGGAPAPAGARRTHGQSRSRRHGGSLRGPASPQPRARHHNRYGRAPSGRIGRPGVARRHDGSRPDGVRRAAAGGVFSSPRCALGRSGS